MYLYNSYCYPDLQAVSDSIQSKLILDGFGVIQSITSSGDVLTINYQLPDTSISSVEYTALTCEQIGFNNSYSGINTDDAIEISGYIMVAFAVAYGFKIMRRGL